MDIVIYPADILRKKASQVETFDSSLNTMVQDMIQTMQGANGVGLAAPQVGLSLRLFVVQVPEEDVRVFINPSILFRSQKQIVMEEGCLSIPFVCASITRPAKLGVRASHIDGSSFFLEAEAWLARVILHEYDHLEGKLFIDYLTEEERNEILKTYQGVF